jgi:hypothetical protein
MSTIIKLFPEEVEAYAHVADIFGTLQEQEDLNFRLHFTVELASRKTTG